MDANNEVLGRWRIHHGYVALTIDESLYSLGGLNEWLAQ
jgi:hypothetical protein